jgi:hypothetical protein
MAMFLSTIRTRSTTIRCPRVSWVSSCQSVDDFFASSIFHAEYNQLIYLVNQFVNSVLLILLIYAATIAFHPAASGKEQSG